MDFCLSIQGFYSIISLSSMFKMSKIKQSKIVYYYFNNILFVKPSTINSPVIALLTTNSSIRRMGSIHSNSKGSNSNWHQLRLWGGP